MMREVESMYNLGEFWLLVIILAGSEAWSLEVKLGLTGLEMMGCREILC